MITAAQAAATAELKKINQDIVNSANQGRRHIFGSNLNNLTVETLRENGFQVSDNSHDKNRSYNQYTIKW